MGTAAKPTRAHRTSTVDVQHETTDVQRLGDGQAFLEWVLAFILSSGLQLTHQATCRGGGGLTRHAHDRRLRLGGVTIWRLQCPTCNAVCTVLPHVVWRSRQMPPEVARHALLATHGGLSVERCAVLCHLAPMARDRLVCAFGHQRLVAVLTRCGLALPVDVLADETPRHWLRDHVYRPTMVHGRVRWHLGDTEDASAAALTQSYQACPRVGLPHAPASRVRGILTDGFDSTTKRRRTLCPGARLGHCLRHALTRLPKQLTALASPVRTALRSRLHPR